MTVLVDNLYEQEGIHRYRTNSIIVEEPIPEASESCDSVTKCLVRYRTTSDVSVSLLMH